MAFATQAAWFMRTYAACTAATFTVAIRHGSDG
jgi:hypothetical protein